MTKDKKGKAEITYEIEKIYGYIGKKKTQVLAKVSWNGRPARTELRNCWYDKDDEMRLGKGVVIEDDDVDELIDLLKKMPKPVDFNDIFKEAGGIIEKRAQGFRTVDGYIVLTPRKSKL